MNNEKTVVADNNYQNVKRQSSDNAFQYLKSLPRNESKMKTSAIIDMDIAQSFTDSFRMSDGVFTIPVSWSLTKAALLSLLGVTDYDGYEAITGVRFYAGLNENRQLTLIAVSTQADENEPSKNNDLTVNDQYPYYDYADPCPNHCSDIGNLRLLNNYPINMNFARVTSQQ